MMQSDDSQPGSGGGESMGLVTPVWHGEYENCSGRRRGPSGGNWGDWTQTQRSRDVAASV
jgi:hypothetical protein